MSEPNPSQASSFEGRMRRRRRRQLAALFLAGLWVLAWAAMTLNSLIVSTQWRALLNNGDLFLGLVAAPLVALPLGGVAALVRAMVLRSRWARWRWHAAIAAPVVVALAFQSPDVLDRMFPRRIFHEYTGQPIPADAGPLTYTANMGFIEQHFIIEFGASERSIDDLLDRLGFESSHTGGSEDFLLKGPGDMLLLTVDWDSGRVRLEYLNV